MMRNLSNYLEFIAGSPELMILLKATLIVALGLLLLAVNRSARASVRHLLLTCTFMVLLALPIATFVAPSFSLNVEDKAPPQSVKQLTVVPSETSTETRTVNLPGSTSSRVQSITSSAKTIVWVVWLSGAALLLVKLATSLLRLRAIRRSAIPSLEINERLQELARETGLPQSIESLLHDDVVVPFTYGVRRPVILLPNDAWTWNEMDLRRVFVHELEHIKRRDWSVQVMARVVCAIYWFQPLVWIAWGKICLEAERACDDAVLSRTDQTDYAEQLVNLARRLANTLAPPVLSMANRSDLSRRVSSILDNTQARGRVGFRWSVSALSLSAVLLLTVAPGLAINRTQTQTVEVKTLNRSDSKARALDRALLEAAEEGKLKDIEELLSAGANINAVVEGDGTALIIAAREGNEDAVSLLLKLGADVNLPAAGDGNPLIMAAREGHEKIVALLLDRGALIDQIVERDENALIQASSSGWIGVVKLLVSRGADVNARAWSGDSDGEWRTALSMAKRKGHKDVVDFLTAIGAHD
jgi:bla regulator protein BlaR1